MEAMTMDYKLKDPQRCQLADFRPRMSRNFAAIDHALSADPSLYNQTHLLSVSFDPAYAPGTLLRRSFATYNAGLSRGIEGAPARTTTITADRTSITAMSIVIRTFQRVPVPTIAKASVVATR
jgi:hypothetical protein